jgi:hypothetical protein
MELLNPVVQVTAQEMHINWLRQQLDQSELRKQDPAEYMARKSELDDAQTKVNQTKQNLRQQAQEGTSGLNEKQREQQVEWVQTETQALIDKKPELADQGTFKEWSERLTQFAVSNGFKAEDITGISDHRILLILDKARQFDEGVDTGRRKRRAKPQKTVKSGPRTEQKPAPKDAAEILYG